MASRNRYLGAISNTLMAILLLPLVWKTTLASDGHPVAIRYWPGSGISIETMWNFHIAIGVDSDNREKLPRAADVEFVDDFWAASGTDTLVLDRKPNEIKARLKPAIESNAPSGNAVTFFRVALASAKTGKLVSLNVIAVDGVTIVDSNKTSANELVAMLREVKEIPPPLRSIDVLLIDDATADVAIYQSLQGMLKPRTMVLRNSVNFDSVGDTPVVRVAHNTLAISKSAPTGNTAWFKLSEATWLMHQTLGDLFSKKEAACKSSRAVFTALSINQLNFRPSNGSHTPRWNTEHMMGRELLFFSQIYHAVDSRIPILDLNPKQMPPDYRAAHADWTGFEESLQMERVEAFTKRFAYLLEGMDLDKTAKGSTFWTPRALLRQMDVHYTEHTANVVKKQYLDDWPKE